MTNSNQAGLQKLNEASLYREKCEKCEKKAKQIRNLVAIFFLLSVVLIIGANLFLEPPLFGRIHLHGFTDILPIIENVALPVAIFSLVLLVVSVMKSISLETKANKARNIEGYIAQHLYRAIILKAKRN
jgi:hypothetical protein